MVVLYLFLHNKLCQYVSREQSSTITADCEIPALF